MKNLKAYYCSDSTEDSTITPVNTFRVIFNKDFGQNYLLLEDRSLYSVCDIPYNHEEVPNDCKP